jgi:hypothetical protein
VPTLEIIPPEALINILLDNVFVASPPLSVKSDSVFEFGEGTAPEV